MDPLSILSVASSAGGLAVMLLQAASVVGTVVAETRGVNEEVQSFVEEMRIFARVLNTMDLNLRIPQISLAVRQSFSGAELWRDVLDSLQKCTSTVKELQRELQPLQGQTSNVLRRAVKSGRLNMKSGTIVRLRRQIKAYKDTMQLSLHMFLIIDSQANRWSLQERIAIVDQVVQTNLEESRNLRAAVLSSQNNGNHIPSTSDQEIAQAGSSRSATDVHDHAPNAAEVMQQQSLSDTAPSFQSAQSATSSPETGSTEQLESTQSSQDSITELGEDHVSDGDDSVDTIERDVQNYESLSRVLNSARSIVMSSTSTDASSTASSVSMSRSTLDAIDNWIWSETGPSMATWARLEARIPMGQPRLGRYEKAKGYTPENLNDLCDEIDELCKTLSMRQHAASLLRAFFDYWDRTSQPADQSVEAELREALGAITNPSEPEQYGVGVRSMTSQGKSLAGFLALIGRSEFLTILFERGDVNVGRDGQSPGPLHVAAAVGDSELLLLLLERGLNPSSFDDRGRTPLIAACENKHEVCAQILISRTDQITAQMHNGETALHLAIRYEMSETAGLLISAAASEDIDVQDELGVTPFLEACKTREGFLSSEMLLTKGANPSIRSHDNQSALAVACKANDSALVQLIIDKTDLQPFSPHDIAEALVICFRNGEISTASLFLAHRSFSEIPVESKREAFLSSCTHNNVQLGRMLLQHNSVPLEAMLRREEGSSPLILACKHTNVQILELLLEFGIHIDSVDGPQDKDLLDLVLSTLSSCNDLIAVSRSRQSEILRLLVEHDKHHFVHAKARHNYSSLHVAVAAGIADRVFGWMVDASQEKNPHDAFGRSVMAATILLGRNSFTSLLVEVGLSSDLSRTADEGEQILRDAAANRRLTEFCNALTHGANPNRLRDAEAQSILDEAVTQSHVRTVALILRKSVKNHAYDDRGSLSLDFAFNNPQILRVFVEDEDRSNPYCLLRAVLKGSEAGVRNLIASGANLNATSGTRGLSALHLAAEMDSLPMVELLTAQGAQVNIASATQQTPLHVAAARNNRKIVHALLRAGADLRAVDESGRTARDFAKAANCTGDFKAELGPPTPFHHPFWDNCSIILLKIILIVILIPLAPILIPAFLIDWCIEGEPFWKRDIEGTGHDRGT